MPTYQDMEATLVSLPHPTLLTFKLSSLNRELVLQGKTETAEKMDQEHNIFKYNSTFLPEMKGETIAFEIIRDFWKT